WLKSFLNIGPDRPKWAYVADILIGEHPLVRSGIVKSLSKFNVFLQTWEPSLRSPTLPRDLKEMLQTAHKHGANFTAPKIASDLKKKLPMWYHLGARETLRRLNNSPRSDCLRSNHALKTVGDIYTFTRRIRNSSTTPPHVPHAACACSTCTYDRLFVNCTNPHGCCTTALRLLETLPPKWDPTVTPVPDGLTLTHRRWRANTEAIATREGSVTFDPTITIRGDLAEGFRVFTNETSASPLPAHRSIRLGVTDNTPEVSVVVASAATRLGQEDAAVGGGLWFDVEDPRNRCLRVPGARPGLHAGELVAIVAAAETVPNFTPLHI
ncbi:hypothetical protein BV25DRAFT_1769617, partial [Artomyces pyxidatus]